MTQVDRFTIPTWSMIAGDRSIEEMLFAVPAGYQLAIWGGLGPTLATVGGISDLAILEPRRFNRPNLHVPLSCCNPGPNLSLTSKFRGSIYTFLLENLFAINCWSGLKPGNGQFVLGVGLTKEAFVGQDTKAYRLAREIEKARAVGAQLLFLKKEGTSLHPAIAPFAQDSLAVFGYQSGLRNLLFDERVEDLVWSAAPQQIVVITTNWEQAFYTAIGAVDLLLLEKAKAEGELSYPQRLSVGKRVVVLTLVLEDESRPWQRQTVHNTLVNHLSSLGVVDFSGDAYTYHQPWEVSILPERM